MALFTKQISHDFYSASQIDVTDIGQIAAQGFKTIMNCRPDGEDALNQPTSQQLEAAAQQLGLHYMYLPIVMGTDVAQQAKAAASLLESAPKPVLGFCKSGMRASNLYLATANVY